MTPKPVPDLATAIGRLDAIPPRPAVALDPALDAVERCFIRYGVRRTSMTDIAREMGVARTTLYRQVPSIEDAFALVLSRQLFTLLDELSLLLANGAGPEAFISATVQTVRFVRSSPIATRLLNEEAEIIGGLVTSGRVPDYIAQVIELTAPIFKAAMASGSIRAGDPRRTASIVIRLIVVLILVPADDLELVVRMALEPLLRTEART